MRPPTILRIPEGMKITVPSPLDTAIRSRLGDELTIKPYSDEPDLLQSTQQRIESLLNAFDFLCEADPPGEIKRAEIKPYLDWCHQHCCFKRSEEHTSELQS